MRASTEVLLVRGFGYNASTDTYEDLMSAGIIDLTKPICWVNFRW
ncbi:putative groEL-like equatorial domain superfamily [Helianthus debilis subsp. tardiflorus]